MFNKENSQLSIIWEKPTVEDLGEAQDIIRAINQAGGGDELFDLLLST